MIDSKACQRILSKPKNSKETITVEMLEALVSKLKDKSERKPFTSLGLQCSFNIARCALSVVAM